MFDAGLFGKHWHSTAWGETVVSDALAGTTLKINEMIQSRAEKVASGAAAQPSAKESN